MSRHSNDSLTIYTVDMDPTPVHVAGITNMGATLNSEILTPDTADPYDVFQSIGSQMPEIDFTTESIATILDTIGHTGKCITSDGTHAGVVAYQRKHDPCGPKGRASSNHCSVTFGQGHIVIESLNATPNSNATIGLRVHATSADEQTQPYVVAYNATPPTSPVNDEHYLLGAVVLGGLTIGKVTSLAINYNPQIEKPQYAGSIWPTIIDMQKVRASITVVTEDQSILNDTGKIPRDGVLATHANTSFKLIKRKAGEFYESLSSEVHINATAAGLLHVSNHFRASGGGVSATELTLLTYDDGTNAPIVWDTTAAVD